MTRFTTYLFITALLLAISVYAFNTLGVSLVGLTEHNANQIRKAGDSR